MPFNATEFRSSFDKLDPAKNNYFDVIFSNVPRAVINPGNSTEGSFRVWDKFMQNLPFRAAATDLPGRNLDVFETKYAGPNINIPFTPVYQSLTIEFIEDSSYSIRGIFDRWLDFQRRGEKVDQRPSGQYTEINALVYYDDYIVDALTINVYDKSTKQLGQFTFYECYPVAIAPTSVSWENNNSILRVPIEFVYRHYEFKRFIITG